MLVLENILSLLPPSPLLHPTTIQYETETHQAYDAVCGIENKTGSNFQFQVNMGCYISLILDEYFYNKTLMQVLLKHELILNLLAVSSWCILQFKGAQQS